MPKERHSPLLVSTTFLLSALTEAAIHLVQLLFQFALTAAATHLVQLLLLYVLIRVHPLVYLPLQIIALTGPLP